MSSPAQAASADTESSFAPELPLDALRIVLAPHAGNVAQLCAAACVSRVWRAAAAERQLWKTLVNFLHLKSCKATPRLMEVTDARLAELVARAGSGEPHLERLDVSFCEHVSAQGVVAALAGAGLEGKLVQLYFAGVHSSEGDDDVVPLLHTFLRDGRKLERTDVGQRVLCNFPQQDGEGQPSTCSSLCTHVMCTLCEINRCCWCFTPPCWVGEFPFTPVCRHMCADCGKVRGEGELSQCLACELPDRETELLCDDCLGVCSVCARPHCVRYHSDALLRDCWYCDLAYCQECLLNEPWDQCSLCIGRCCKQFDCADVLKTAAEWVDELPDDVDAAVVERLLAAGEEAAEEDGKDGGHDDGGGGEADLL